MFALVLALFVWAEGWAQCLTLPNAAFEQLNAAEKIIEGKVIGQQTFLDALGNIYTANSIEVYRVFKGNVGFELEVVTEGGIHGDLMQVVTPSAQMQIGDYGILVIGDDASRSLSSIATAFYPVNERSGTVYGMKHVSDREAVYETIARTIGSHAIQLRRIPNDLLQDATVKSASVAPVIASVFPLEVTAGTKTVLTITGQGFGAEQGQGHVAFRNADDGGQSYVSLSQGPHYLSWTDTQIEMYVPSATLYNNTVAGTGAVRVVTANGQIAQSTQQVTVEYAKSEVIYSGQLNNTMLVGMQSGGYMFKKNDQLVQFLGGSSMVERVFATWACNTGVNFVLDSEPVNITDWAHDGVNLIGLSGIGQLPAYLLGKTITTFSGCGTPNGIQWNLIEIDIVLNRDIEWWTGEGPSMGVGFDLETAMLHEIGHGHLLQHNNNTNSPMYFQLTEGATRRSLYAPSIDGGSYVSTQSVEAASTCSNQPHQYFDFSNCDLSLVNGVDEASTDDISVYPNPFNDQISISGQWTAGTGYVLYDATGRMILNGALNANDVVLGTAQLTKGIYLLEVRDEHATQVLRLVKN